MRGDNRRCRWTHFQTENWYHNNTEATQSPPKWESLFIIIINQLKFRGRGKKKNATKQKPPHPHNPAHNRSVLRIEAKAGIRFALVPYFCSLIQPIDQDWPAIPTLIPVPWDVAGLRLSLKAAARGAQCFICWVMADRPEALQRAQDYSLLRIIHTFSVPLTLPLPLGPFFSF